jgi:hypothetical protein
LLRGEINGRGLVCDFDVLTDGAGGECDIDANRLADRDDDVVALLRGEGCTGCGDGVAADRDRWRAVETLAAGDELTLAAGLLVADHDGGAGDGGAGCVGDGAADRSADDLRVRWRGGKYECCEDAGDDWCGDGTHCADLQIT